MNQQQSVCVELSTTPRETPVVERMGWWGSGYSQCDHSVKGENLDVGDRRGETNFGLGDKNVNSKSLLVLMQDEGFCFVDMMVFSVLCL